MSDDNKSRDDDKNGKKTGEFKVPPRTYIIWIAILGAIPLLMLFRNNAGSPGEILTQTQFFQKVDSNLVTKGLIIYDPQSPFLHEVRGNYFKTDAEGNKVLEGAKAVVVPFVAKVRLTDKLEDKVLSSGAFETKQPNTVLLGIVYSLFPILLIGLLIWFFFIRQIKMAGKGALSFGKSKARMLDRKSVV